MRIIVLAYLFCGKVQERRFSYEIILEIYDLMWKFVIVPLDTELIKVGLVLNRFFYEIQYDGIKILRISLKLCKLLCHNAIKKAFMRQLDLSLFPFI